MANTQAQTSTPIVPFHLMAALRDNPLGISETQPRLWWEDPLLDGHGRQTAYEIRLNINKTVKKDTGWVKSDKSVALPWPFSSLLPLTSCSWQVRVQMADEGHSSVTSGWSAPQVIVRGPESVDLWNKALPIWTSGGTPITASEPGPRHSSDGLMNIILPTRTEKGNGVLHLLFRAADDGNDGYALSVDSGKKTLVFQRKMNGVFTPLCSSFYSSGTYQENLDITLKCHATTATALIGGQKLLQLDHVKDAGGAWGLQAEGSNIFLKKVDLKDGKNSPLAHATAPDFSTPLPWFMRRKDGLLLVPKGSAGMLGEPQAGDYWALLRKTVNLPAGTITSAFLFATAANPLGARQYVYRLLVNGQQAGTGPSRNAAGPLYETHNVTSLVHPGTNLLAALCWTQAGGWFRALLAVTYKDGRKITIGTDGTWLARSGKGWRPWNGDLNNSVHYYVAPREDVDARQEPDGWDTDPLWDSQTAQKTGFHHARVLQKTLPCPHADPSPSPSCLFRRPTSIRRINRTRWLVDAGIESAYAVDLIIHNKQADSLSGTRLRLRMGEQLLDAQKGEVRFETLSCMRFEDEWTLRNGSQHLWHWGYRGFRWLQVDLPKTASDKIASIINVALHSGLRLRTDVVPEPEETASFTCSDKDLTSIWKFCSTGIREGRQDLFMDTPVRERMPYEGDALTHGRCEMAFSRSYSIMRKTWRYLVRRPGKFTEYRFMMAPLAWEDYLETGDIDALRGDWKLLWDEQAFYHVGEDGLVTKDPKSPGCTDIVDWPQPGELDGFVFTSVNTVVNVWALQGFDHLALIAGALGLQKHRQKALAVAGRLRQGLQNLFVTDSGAWKDGLHTEHTALHSTLYAISLGAASPEQKQAGGRWLVNRNLPQGIPISPNAATWLLEALFLSGQAQTGMDVMASHSTTSWWSMMHRWGATQPMEGWSPKTKWNTTFAHPWAAGPLWVIARHILGVRVTEAGAKTVEIRPQIGTLTWVRGEVPTIRGIVSISITPNRARFSIPANTTAYLCFDGKKRHLKPGTTVIERKD